MTGDRKTDVYERVCNFWQTYGVVLAGENGGGTLKSAFVWKMKELDEDMRAGKGWDIIRRRVLDILGEQRLCMIQFECCLDEFNTYLDALRVLDTLLQHRIFEA